MTAPGRPAAVLFDLDGTLADSLPDLAGALNDLLEEQGWRHCTMDEVRLMVGGGVPKLIERALDVIGQKVDEDRSAGLISRFMELYTPRAARLTKLNPGAMELLREFSDAGVGLGVCTNKPEAVTQQILDALGVLDMMGAVIGGDTTPAKKPDAAPVLAALEQLGCSPASGLLIGDSPADAGAARAAGVPVILVSFGYTQTPVHEIDADGVVDSFDEVAGMLEKMTFQS